MYISQAESIYFGQRYYQILVLVWGYKSNQTLRIDF